MSPAKSNSDMLSPVSRPKLESKGSSTSVATVRENDLTPTVEKSDPILAVPLEPVVSFKTSTNRRTARRHLAQRRPKPQVFVDPQTDVQQVAVQRTAAPSRALQDKKEVRNQITLPGARVKTKSREKGNTARERL